MSATSPAPLVSVIVPSFNMAEFLPATLDSILAQDYRPLEVVVVDGASTDGTVDLLHTYAKQHPELRWVSEPDDGPADAVNKGLSLIRGEIAAIQSADDIYYPGAVHSAVAGFDAHPAVAIVYGDAAIIDADGVVQGTTHYLPYTLCRYLCGSTFISQSSSFFRPALAREVGGCRDRYFVFDIDLWLRMLFHAPAYKLPAVMSAYRRHETQRDKATAEILSSYQQMIRESEAIAHASLRVRLAASAGARMLTQHYNPTGDLRHQTSQLWRAILTYPPSIRALFLPRMLVPPPPTLRGVARRLKRLTRHLQSR